MKHKYQFSEKWFDNNIPVWDVLFKQYTEHFPKIDSVLEIGCFEGRATVYLCDKWLQPNTQYDIVDTFGATECETGMQSMVDKLKTDSDHLYNTFKHNISFHSDIHFNIFRDYSQSILPQLCNQDRIYNVIYIDASHRADDTFTDAFYANKMLSKNGILIFDDYAWKDPLQSDDKVNSPQFGVDVFIEMYRNEYSITHKGYQMILQKL